VRLLGRVEAVRLAVARQHPQELRWATQSSGKGLAISGSGVGWCHLLGEESVQAARLLSPVGPALQPWGH
jgi:hypothetical protein